MYDEKISLLYLKGLVCRGCVRYPMRVESYGDCLTSGTYHVHARFRRTAHFISGQILVSLVDPTIGKGPNHIVAAGLDIGAVETIEIGDQIFLINGTACAREEERKYSSQLTPGHLNIPKLQKNIHVFEQCVYADAPENSLPNLLGLDMHMLENSPFNSVLLRQFISGWQAMKGGAFETGVRLLLGAGLGLTPSGDDFVAGYCSGLYLGGARYARHRMRIAETIDHASGATNILSHTMLRYCCRGRFYERVKDLLVALISGNTREVSDRASAMCAVGETSGADFSFGLLCALQDVTG